MHREIVKPVLEEFRPELILVSVGYDAHERDPLASMRMTTQGYQAVVAHLCEVGMRHGALALVTEGGYDLATLKACLDTSISVLEGGHLRGRLTHRRHAARAPSPRFARY